MKHLLTVTLIINLLMSSCWRTPKQSIQSQSVEESQESIAVNELRSFSDPATWLLGYFNLSRLSQKPYSEWFITGKDSYNVNEEALLTLKKILVPEVNIKIVLGTWCSDSRREVPRFIKVMEMSGFPVGKIEFIGVDDSKISPIENYQSLDIQRVPTFIVYRNKVEAGRIIEVPVASLEQDMVNILSRNEK